MAISHTIHTVCCKDNYFPQGKFKLFNIIFSLSVPCFSKTFVFYCRFVCLALSVCQCNKGKSRVVAQCTVDIHVAWLVYVCMYHVPIAFLNQNKQTRLLCLGDAQIISKGTTKSKIILQFSNSLIIHTVISQSECPILVSWMYLDTQWKSRSRLLRLVQKLIKTLIKELEFLISLNTKYSVFAASIITYNNNRATYYSFLDTRMLLLLLLLLALNVKPFSNAILHLGI